MMFAPELAAVAFGLFASLSWGVSDFSGGVATKKVALIGVVAVSHLVGLLLLIALAIGSNEPIPPIEDVVWGALAGLAGLVGVGAFYHALAVGRMGIAAPTAAVLSAALVAGFGILLEGLPTPSKIIGFCLGIASIGLVSYSHSERHETSGLSFAALAGVGIAVFLILLARVGAGSLFWPLVVARIVSSTLMFAVALKSHQNWIPRGRTLWSVVILAGLLDVTGNAFFIMSRQAGRLDIAAILSSLYPAVTVVLARLVLKEHVSRLQAIGIGAALLAISLIAVG
jgi:drug/metabolite transporter (DMT)-like permease